MTKILKIGKRVVCLTMVMLMMVACLPLNAFAATPNIVIVNNSGNSSIKGSNVVIINDAPEEPKAQADDDVDYVDVALDEATIVAETKNVAKVGDTEFESVLEAIEYAVENGSAEIKLLADSRELMPTDIEIILKADLTITADAPVKVEFYNKGTTYDFVVGSTNNHALIIGENVHFDLVDRVIWLGYYGNNVDVVVKGYLGGYQIWHGADTTVSSTGMLDSHGEAFIMRRNATLTVSGGKVNANYFHIYSGHIDAKDATITAGLVWIYNNHDYGSEGTVSFELENTSFSSNGEVKVYAGEGKTVPIALTNGTEFKAAGKLTLGDRASVTADDNSSFTAENASVFVAKVGTNQYVSLEAAAAAAKAGDTITLLADVTLSAELTLPAGITLNGNGKQINGTIYAGGDLTFVGHTKVTSFSASYYDRTITIGEGACLEITGTGRVSLAYGNTFNITGTITDAKTAGKANIQPSLIIPGGISITGSSDATMNVTNAYIVIGSTSSKNSDANGTFNLNFTNSIVEFTNQFTFAEPTNGKNPTFNVKVKDSVLTTGTKFVVAAPNSNVVIDNSVVTLGTYFRNSGNFTLKNGSVLTGKTIQFGENGGNNGTLIVDASTLTITASSTGHALDGKETGKIVLMNGAKATIDYITQMAVIYDQTSAFAYTDLGTNSTVNQAVAKTDKMCYATLTEAIAAAQAGDTITLLADVTLSEILTIDKTITFDGNGKTLTSTAARAINIETTGTVEIKNLIIKAGERAINIINQAATVQLDNVTATAKNNAVMIATSAGAVNLTINNSNLTGLAVVNVAGEDSSVAINNTKITNVDATAAENYGAITVWSSATYAKVVVTGGEIIVADDSKAAYVFPANATVEGVEDVAYIVATLGDAGFDTLEEAIAEAKAGDTIVLVRDVNLSELIKIEKAITLDLNGNTVTSTAKKAFEIYANATIRNGIIKGANRCVDTRKAVNLTLIDLTLIADDYTSAFGNPQPLTIGGSENGTKVTMNNVNISAKDGYGIITFVKTELTAKNSIITGYSALYVKPGSENAVFNFVNTDLSGSIGTNDVESNSFSTIAVRADNVTVTLDEDSTLNANGTHYSAISLNSSYAGEESCSGVTITVMGTITADNVLDDNITGHKIFMNAENEQTMKDAGYGILYAQDGMIQIVPPVTVDVNDNFNVTDEKGDSLDADVKDITNDIKDNETVNNYNPIKEIEEIMTFEVTLKNVTLAGGSTLTAITYNVAPKNVENNKVEKPSQAITFRLSVPNSMSGSFVEVYHNGKLMGIYAVQTNNDDRYVEITSDSFSEFTVKTTEVESADDFVAMIGDVGFLSLADALAAAQTGNTIKLLVGNDEFKNGTIVLNKGITLDLNGQTLTAAYLVAFKGNHVVDSDTTSAGLLNIAKDNISLSKGNDHMLVWVGTGYKFAKAILYTLLKNETANGFGFKFRPAFNETIYSVLKSEDSIEASGLKFMIRISWTDNAGWRRYQDFVCSAERVKDMYVKNEASLLTVAGFSDNQTQIEVNLIVTSEIGVEASLHEPVEVTLPSKTS